MTTGAHMPPTELVVRTPRLDLVAATLDHLDAELCDPAALERLLKARVPPSWPPGEYDRSAQELFRDRLATGGPAAVGWLTWYAVTREASGRREALVAGAGFLGPPAGGAVEIGFSVVPEARGLGFASEIARALVAHAFEHPEVHEILAHTSDENVPSTRVLLRCGFSRVGPGSEPGSVEYRVRSCPHAGPAERRPPRRP